MSWLSSRLYREQGHYWNAIYKWAKAVGPDSIRPNLRDPRAPGGRSPPLPPCADLRPDRSLGQRVAWLPTHLIFAPLSTFAEAA